jgi:hypothetical protein
MFQIVYDLSLLFERNDMASFSNFIYLQLLILLWNTDVFD